MVAYHRRPATASRSSAYIAGSDRHPLDHDNSHNRQDQSLPTSPAEHERHIYPNQQLLQRQHFRRVYETMEPPSELHGYLPPEPTPPDSGRSKLHNPEYSFDALDLESEISADEGESDHSATALPRTHCKRPAGHGARQTSPKVAARYSQQTGPRSAGPSSCRNHRLSHSPQSPSSSSSPISPHITVSKPYHAGVVFDQRPIRDTPNNPFLEEHKRRLPGTDGTYDEKRHGRGEEAARAHRKGFLTYVFRGQRILHPDIASDDDSDEDTHFWHSGSGTRLQPKLLFPEAHAQERRRERMRGTRSLQYPTSRGLPTHTIHLGSPFQQSLDLEEHRGRSSEHIAGGVPSVSGIMPPLAPSRDNLFAAEISRRQADQEETKRKRSHVSQIDDENDADHEAHLVRKRRRGELLGGQTDDQQTVLTSRSHHANEAPCVAVARRSKSQAGLLAQLERAGWFSGSGSEDEAEDQNVFRSRGHPEVLCTGVKKGTSSYEEEAVGMEGWVCGEGEETDWEDEGCVAAEASSRAAVGKAVEPGQRRPGMLRSMSDNPFDLSVY